MRVKREERVWRLTWAWRLSLDRHHREPEWSTRQCLDMNRSQHHRTDGFCYRLEERERSGMTMGWAWRWAVTLDRSDATIDHHCFIFQPRSLNESRSSQTGHDDLRCFDLPRTDSIILLPSSPLTICSIFFVFEWQMVTVALACLSNSNIGVPTILLRPITTAVAPSIVVPNRRSRSIVCTPIFDRHLSIESIPYIHSVYTGQSIDRDCHEREVPHSDRTIYQGDTSISRSHPCLYIPVDIFVRWDGIGDSIGIDLFDRVQG